MEQKSFLARKIKQQKIKKKDEKKRKTKWGKVEAAAKLKFMKLGNRQFDSVHTQEALQRVPAKFSQTLWQQAATTTTTTTTWNLLTMI